MLDQSRLRSRRRVLWAAGTGGLLAALGFAARRWHQDSQEKAKIIDPYYSGDAEPGPVTEGLIPPVRTGATIPITLENAQSGTRDFTLTGHRFSDDTTGQIAGYTGATSVSAGETLDFHVSVAPAQRYRVWVYRLGHYGGAGARLVATSPWLNGRTQPPPTTHSNGMLSCDWTVGWRLQIKHDWISGFYLALLASSSGHHQWVPFVVRDRVPATAGLVILPTSTYQAYNQWPRDGRTGRSLYYGYDAAGQRSTDHRSEAVSYDRPYSGNGIPSLARHDIGFVQWVEGQGYNLSYATNEDLHTGRVNPSRYQTVIFCGHDEYWSVEMRRAAATARDNGTSLVFLGANNCYWRIRYGTSDEQPDERIVGCDKNMTKIKDPIPLTTQWRLAGNPEQQLLGGQYISVIDGHAPLVVQDSGHWFWAGTGLRHGDQIPKVVWGEADQVMPKVRKPKAVEEAVLAASPYTRKGQSYLQNTVLYRAPSGAWVFLAGTLGWTAALYLKGTADSRIQRATRNLLDRVLAARP